MNRNLMYLLGALGVGVLGFLWVRKNKAGPTSPGTAGSGSAAAFTQQQEVSDFQIFSALTSQQQASDLNFLGQAASLFSGGSSTSASGTGSGSVGGSGTSTSTPAPPTSSIPSPTPQASAPPATASTSSPGVTYLEPGGPVNFSAPPPPGYGYGYQNGQWGLIPGGGVGYVAA